MTDPKNKPDQRGHKELAMAGAIDKCRDLGSGSDTVMAAGGKYLPQHPKESHDNYQIRLRRPTYVNFFGRTVAGLTGLVFRRDPTLGDDVPKPIVDWWENIDNKGTHGDVFAQNLFSNATEAGHSVLVVDIPRNEAMNLAQEREMGIRPYWVEYAAEDVVSTRTVTENGREKLEQIVFRSVTWEPDGAFGEKEVTRYRQYFLGTGEDGKRAVGITVWEKVTGPDGTSEFVIQDVGVLTSISEIPAIYVYGDKVDSYISRPPLADLANLNILHYQTSSDLYHVMHIADVPVPVVTGVSKEQAAEIVISPNASLALPEGADVKYLETEGTAIGHTSAQLKELKGDMAMLGLSFLSPDKRAAETAEAKRIDKADSDSALSAIARSLEDGLERALGYTAQLAGLGDEGGSIEINKDYEDVTLTPEQVTVYAKLVADGVLTQETLWAILIQGELLPPDFDPEVEAQALEDAVAKLAPVESDSAGP